MRIKLSPYVQHIEYQHSSVSANTVTTIGFMCLNHNRWCSVDDEFTEEIKKWRAIKIESPLLLKRFIYPTTWMCTIHPIYVHTNIRGHTLKRWVDDVGEKDLHTSRFYDGLLVITHNEPPRFIVSAHPSDWLCLPTSSTVPLLFFLVTRHWIGTQKSFNVNLCLIRWSLDGY